MALPTVTITIVLSVPAGLGQATTAATAVPVPVQQRIKDFTVEAVRRANPVSRENSADGPLAGDDAIAVTFTSIAVA